MAVTYNRPPGMKYVDMCIWIDENSEKIRTNGEYPEIESQIYEYLYHIIYALACKGTFFKSFEDYDPFALYGASEVYIAMRNKLVHAGETVRGKTVEPIKSCLNFIKTVLLPLKVNYQKQTFYTVFDPQLHDTSKMSDDMSESIKSCYRPDLLSDLNEVLDGLPSLMIKILKTTPYRKDKVLLHKLYVSCQLTLLDNLTLPNRIRNKLDKKESVEEDILLNLYTNNSDNVILWHLNVDYKDYVNLLVKRIKEKISDELTETRKANDLSDNIVDDIIKSAYATYDLNTGE